MQWSYLLFGLRDGHPNVMQKLTWGPWTGKGQKQICAGRAVRIQLARIIPIEAGEIVAQVFERLTMYAHRTAGEEKPEVEHPLYQVIEQDISLPPKWLFGLKPTERPVLFFPAVGAQPHLWNGLKNPRSVKDVRQTANEIYRWLTAAVPGVRHMPQFRRVLCDYPAELFKARRLWNYPGTDRPTSDDKRIEFFAETLAGLMMEISPATATKKLTRWKPPKLWIGEMKEIQTHEGT